MEVMEAMRKELNADTSQREQRNESGREAGRFPERSGGVNKGFMLVVGMSLIMGLAGGAIGGFAISRITGAESSGSQTEQMGAPGGSTGGNGAPGQSAGAELNGSSEGTGDSASGASGNSEGATAGTGTSNGTEESGEPPAAPGNGNTGGDQQA